MVLTGSVSIIRNTTMNTEIKDEGERTPEEMQERADEQREAFEELDQASLDTVNALANHKAIMKVINKAIK